MTFRYGDAEPALNDLSLEIPPRSTVAFVGASGAGKSTLATLLTGILPPTEGAVRVGDTPYGKLDQSELRRQIGYVTQESVIFSDSVRNNITLWEGDGPDVDAAMREAAEAADIAEFIESLPDGYDTALGEDGLNVSGGQRQRIAIATGAVQARPSPHTRRGHQRARQRVREGGAAEHRLSEGRQDGHRHSAQAVHRAER